MALDFYYVFGPFWSLDSSRTDFVWKIATQYSLKFHFLCIMEKLNCIQVWNNMRMFKKRIDVPHYWCVHALLECLYLYIYIYAFSRRFYPKRLTLHSSYSFTFYQLLLSLGTEPMILALLAPCSTIWATGTQLYEFSCVQVTLVWARRRCTFNKKKNQCSSFLTLLL